MKATTHSGIIRGVDSGLIDLGNEPPLSLIDEEENERGPILRAVSWRWLAGTVLTGVTSILLMGSALMGALSNPNQFAALPDSFTANAATVDGLNFGEKGDRIRPREEEVSSRQILQVSTVIRQGERDFIKLRPFARINAALSTRRGDLADQVPKYDVLRIFADTSEPEPPTTSPEPTVAAADDRLYGANVDGEVAVRVTAFPIAEPDLEPSVAFTADEVEKIMREFSVGDDFAAATRVAALPYAESLPFDDIGIGDDALAAPDVTIIPENLSNIAKSDGSGAGGLSETVVSGDEGQDISTILANNDVDEEERQQILNALSRLVDMGNLDSTRRIRIGYSPDERRESGVRTMRVSLYRGTAHQATVARADTGAFIRADEPSSLFDIFGKTDTQPQQKTGGPAKLYDAVYEAALEQQIPEPLIDQLVRIFAFDVDFQARAGSSDSLEVFHSVPDANDIAAGDPEILYAALTHGGATKRFYRFRTPDDGVVDYYDVEGKSGKKFLMRKPMTEGRLRSRYGMRRHPILKVRRLHAGVDFAAKRGTPILAAGNGTVKKVTRSSGYGNLTIIKHTNGYETAYAHQSKFAKGLKVGARVRQGQVIGYVGSTGLSTGPHLHFEMRVNGKTVDPLRVRLPRGRVLKDELMTAFETERLRIDKLLGLESPTQLASN